MLNNHILITISCLILFFYTENSIAQKQNPDISQIKYLYDTLRFEKSIEFGQHVLKKEKHIPAQHLEYIHKYMAYSFYNLGMIDSVRIHFLSLLTINPKMELNPVETSPKIIDFFNQIKLNFKELNEDSNIISYPKYIFIEDKRPDAAWRSAILPGWGQYYKGETSRAYILGAAFLTSSVFFAVSIANETKYKDLYFSSTDPDEISNIYEKYNNWSKIRKVLMFSTVGIWIFSFADALWSPYYPNLDFNTSGKEFDSLVLSIKYSF